MRLELARVYQFTDEAQLFSVGLASDPRDAHNAQTKEAIEDLSQALQDSPSPSAHLIGRGKRYLALNESLMQHYFQDGVDDA